MGTKSKSVKNTSAKSNKTKSQFDATPVADTTKTGSAPVAIVPPVINPPVAASIEAQKPAIIPGLDTERDILVTTGNAWNSRYAEVHPVITNRDKVTFPFARFEYVQHRFPGSRFSILRCSDTGHEVGMPFDDESYYAMVNEPYMAFIDTLQAGVEKLGLKLSIQTAGTLKDRSRQFTSFKIEGLEEIEAGGRKMNSFLSLLKGLDKLISFTFVNSTITICCQNTFQMVHDDTGAPLYGKVKFTKNCQVKIDEIPKIVDAFVSGNNALLGKLNHWHSIGVNTTQAEQLFTAWLADADKPMSTRLTNIIERLKVLHVKGKGNKGETALDAFNAVTEYYTHESAGDTSNQSKQFESSEIGDGAKSKGEFFDFLAKAMVTDDTFAGVCKIGDTILVSTNKANKDKAIDRANVKAEKAKEAARKLLAESQPVQPVQS